MPPECCPPSLRNRVRHGPAHALIPDYEGSERNWCGCARTSLTAVLCQMHRREAQDREFDMAEL